MNSHFDLFKKLTFGINFKSKKCNEELKRLKPKSIKINGLEVKEIKEEKNIKIVNQSEDFNIKLFNNSSIKNHIKIKKQLSNEKKAQLEQEAVNHYRNINNISVIGRQIPAPIKSFEELHTVDDELLKRIADCGYKEPTPIQKQAIPILIQSRELLACAPTGSGKTIAFLLPIVQSLLESKRRGEKGCRVLIIAPTRELAKQIQRECFRLTENLNIRAVLISKINKNVEKISAKLPKKYDILVTTPNRICFLLKQEQQILKLSKIDWVVVDEADKLFEDGVRSFRDQLQQILNACTNPNKKIAMFSATLTPTVASWCKHNMKRGITLTIGCRNTAVDTVDQKLLFVSDEHGKLFAIRDIIRKGLKPPCLIFVQSKERAQQLFNELIYDGVNVDVIHADRTQTQRDNTINAFREGRVWVLICTELMARGVDFKGVNLVINYDFPTSTISYIHRIGRTGRAGKCGEAITFFTKDDQINLRDIALVIKNSGGEVPDYMLRMRKRGKKQHKQLLKKAPTRDNITTTPKYELEKRAKRKGKLNKLKKDKLNKLNDKSKLIKKRKDYKLINQKKLLMMKNKKMKNEKKDDKNRKLKNKRIKKK